MPVPTKRPVTITETPAVARRLDLAATRFPDRASSRGDLLLALTEIAEDVLARKDGGEEGRAAAKQRLLARTQAITPGAAEAMLAARAADWQRDLGL